MEGLFDTTAGNLAQVATNFLMSLFLLLPVNHRKTSFNLGHAQAERATCPLVGARPGHLVSPSKTQVLGPRHRWQCKQLSPLASGRGKPSGSGISTCTCDVQVKSELLEMLLPWQCHCRPIPWAPTCSALPRLTRLMGR